MQLNLLEDILRKIESKIDDINRRLDRIEGRMDSLEVTVAQLREIGRNWQVSSKSESGQQQNITTTVGQKKIHQHGSPFVFILLINYKSKYMISAIYLMPIILWTIINLDL
jgi:hypothetical protein